jgi:transposase
MSHIEIHKINGKEYKYEVTNYRVGKSVKHKWKYLGAVKPVQKRKKSFAVGRKPTLKVREMSSEEINDVARALKSNKSFIKDRAKIIQLSMEGNAVGKICEKLKFDRKKTGQVINLFNEFGLKSFERKKGTGRPRRITVEERVRILEWLNTHPEKLGLHFNNWSQNKLSNFAKQNNIRVSSTQIARIIKQDEIKYKTKRSKMFSNDKNFLKNI